MATEQALSAELSRFLADKNTQPEDLLALRAFLRARPAYSKPTSYISDIEQRLELLRDIRKKWEKAAVQMQFTAVLWSALMVIPLEQLRDIRDNPFALSIIKSVIPDTTMLLKVFLAKPLSQDELTHAGVSKKRTRSSTYSEARSEAFLDERNLDKSYRDRKESQKCELRDRYCVVTGTANPDICHIFPFTATNTPDRTTSGLYVVYTLWGEQVHQKLSRMLVGDKNIIDTAMNMVALEPLLHRWWGKAMIGFEPIEKIENGIRLRFRWLSKTKLAMKDEVAWDLNPLDCLQPYADEGGNVKIAHSSTYRPIVDGTVIEIIAQDKSAIPSWDLFSLQWDLIRMASLCGAAEANDDDDWESDDDDDDPPQAKVERTTDDLCPDSPFMASPTPVFLPLRSVPVQSQVQSQVQSREPSPTKFSQLRENSPAKSSQHRENSPAKSRTGRVDENNPW